jgi:hypothetical protein
VSAIYLEVAEIEIQQTAGTPTVLCFIKGSRGDTAGMPCPIALKTAPDPKLVLEAKKAGGTVWLRYDHAGASLDGGVLTTVVRVSNS